MWRLCFDLNHSLPILLIPGTGYSLLIWNRLPDISPAKMRVCWASRELQFRVYNHGEPCASSYKSREGEHFYRGKNGQWESVFHSPQLFVGWVLARKEVFFLPVGLCSPHRMWELPHSGLSIWLRFLFIIFFQHHDLTMNTWQIGDSRYLESYVEKH